MFESDVESTAGWAPSAACGRPANPWGGIMDEEQYLGMRQFGEFSSA